MTALEYTFVTASASYMSFSWALRYTCFHTIELTCLCIIRTRLTCLNMRSTRVCLNELKPNEEACARTATRPAGPERSHAVPLSKRARVADRLLPATTTTVLSPHLSPSTTGPSLEWPWITESPGMHPSNVAAAVLLTFEQLSRRHSADFDKRVHAKREGGHANTDGRTPATELV